jgi:hypothetical protein
MFKKGDKATSTKYGTGVVKSRALNGYANPDKDFDSEEKYDFLPDGSSTTVRVFASTLTKSIKLTSVQIAHRDDPGILEQIWLQYQRGGRVLISCQASRIDFLASEVSACTTLTEIDAVDYISAASEKTHAMKFYVMLPVGADEKFYQRVSDFFGSRTTKASTKEVQYNSRDLAEWLMAEHGVLPEKRV